MELRKKGEARKTPGGRGWGKVWACSIETVAKVFRFSSPVEYCVKTFISKVIFPSFQDMCDEFRGQMKNGQLICTRESDPVRGSDGRIHGNKCAVCKEKL